MHVGVTVRECQLVPCAQPYAGHSCGNVNINNMLTSINIEQHHIFHVNVSGKCNIEG